MWILWLQKMDQFVQLSTQTISTKKAKIAAERQLPEPQDQIKFDLSDPDERLILVENLDDVIVMLAIKDHLYSCLDLSYVYPNQENSSNSENAKGS